MPSAATAFLTAIIRSCCQCAISGERSSDIAAGKGIFDHEIVPRTGRRPRRDELDPIPMWVSSTTVTILRIEALISDFHGHQALHFLDGVHEGPCDAGRLPADKRRLALQQ